MSFHVETERLIIRDFVKDDLPILIAQFSEPAAKSGILPYQSDKEYQKKNFENSIVWAQQEQRAYFNLAVTRKTDLALIGSCTITKVYPESYVDAAIGWHYGSIYWGKGYATEVAGKLLYIGFELNKVNAIYADCFADNIASIRMLEKIGMKPYWNYKVTNLIRGLWYGHNKPTVRYRISKQEWLATVGSASSID